MNKPNKIYYFSALYCVVALSGICLAQNVINKNLVITVADEKKSMAHTAPQVTIWVHGTKSMGRISQAIHSSPRGLLSLDHVPKRYRLRDSLHVLAATDPERFPLAHFYTFGWSGQLCFDKRKSEAQNLYESIKKLNKQYQDSHGMDPEITLITHSHGGNLALNLASVKQVSDNFTLKLIVLACPVQHETEDFVSDALFSRIYSFYSTSDLIQIIDPQGLYGRGGKEEIRLEFSGRQFPDNPKVCQAELKINGYGIAHVGFILQRFMKLLPICIEQLDAWIAQDVFQADTTRIMNIQLKDQKRWLFDLPVDVDRVKHFFSMLRG
ncbi:MAG: hypothetical protein P4L31_06175 [Candidatus Babeliales bacterium]|nr:hypothetical protein [Candidatus Babeliales bacterium]